MPPDRPESECSIVRVNEQNKKRYQTSQQGPSRRIVWAPENLPPADGCPALSRAVRRPRRTRVCPTCLRRRVVGGSVAEYVRLGDVLVGGVGERNSAGRRASFVRGRPGAESPDENENRWYLRAAARSFASPKRAAGPARRSVGAMSTARTHLAGGQQRGSPSTEHVNTAVATGPAGARKHAHAADAAGTRTCNASPFGRCRARATAVVFAPPSFSRLVAVRAHPTTPSAYRNVDNCC